MAQTAVCNRHHSVDQQLCRWLLLSLDRLAWNELIMTQELIANMLGVRREGVTEAAGKLQLAGLIQYRRGKITVLDRPRLEARTCECYQVSKQNSIVCCRTSLPDSRHLGSGSDVRWRADGDSALALRWLTVLPRLTRSGQCTKTTPPDSISPGRDHSAG